MYDSLYILYLFRCLPLFFQRILIIINSEIIDIFIIIEMFSS